MEKNQKQAKNLFKQLINDVKSVFYAKDKINKPLLNEAKKSVLEKDRVFYELYSELEDENKLYEDQRQNISFHIPFIER